MLQTKLVKNSIRLLVILVVLSTLIVGCSKGKQEKVDTINVNLGMDQSENVATYKGGEVSVGEFEKYLDFLTFYYYPETEEITNKDKWNDYAKMYVGQKIIVERAKAKNLSVNKEDWDKAYESTKESISKNLGKDLTYDELLQKVQLTEQEVKDQIHQMLLFSEYFYKIKSDADLKKFYDDNPEYFMLASVRHILIDNQKRSDAEAKKLATELTERIRAGEDFATLANEYTDDEAGNLDKDKKKLGGLYENQPVSNWVEPFKVATMTLPLNEVSDPVKTEYGYHVMRVESRHLVPFDQVKDQIVAQEARNAYNAFVSEELPGLIEKINLPEAKKE